MTKSYRGIRGEEKRFSFPQTVEKCGTRSGEESRSIAAQSERRDGNMGGLPFIFCLAIASWEATKRGFGHRVLSAKKRLTRCLASKDASRQAEPFVNTCLFPGIHRASREVDEGAIEPSR